MSRIDIEKTAYPRIKGNLADEEIMECYTLEPSEIALIKTYKGDKLTLSVRLKNFQNLLNHNLSIKDTPKKVIDYMASQLQITSYNLINTKDSRHRQLSVIRKYTEYSPFSETERDKLDAWLQKTAEKESHLIDVLNEVVFHLKDVRIELPTFRQMVQITSRALSLADKRQKELLCQDMSSDIKIKLDALLKNEVQYQPTPFYGLKEPPENPSAGAILKEIELLERLRSFDLSFDPLKQINNDKVKHFSEIAKSYKSNELYALIPETRYPILLCFIYMRIKEVTDNILELLFRLWSQITKEAERIENNYIIEKDNVARESEDLSEELLKIIVESSSKDEIVENIFHLYTYEDYKSLLEMIRRFKRPKKEKYFKALSTRYSFVRRFIPLLWERITFKSNTSNDSLIQAIDYLKKNLDPSTPELPVKDAPVDFVPDDWNKHVFIRQRGTRKILSINKNMYELCVIDQIIDKIIACEVYVMDSQYYSSLEEYLIPQDEFMSMREVYIEKLDLPRTAEEFTKKLSDELEELLDYMNRNYNKLSSHTKVSKGALSFSRLKGEENPPRVKELSKRIIERINTVSIIDILIDVDKVTGFLDMFETIGYKEGMTRKEKAQRMMATLLCYGGNFGPAQTERSTGVSAANVLYMRRRYCSEENLLKAIGYLSDCQHKTWLAYAYGDGTGFITDGTMFSAPKRSMHTEHHFRYSKGRGVIAYPIISNQCIALITEAITCSQYEAIQMFEAFYKQKSHLPLLKNFADSHGQSFLTFAFARLLHIDLLPRLRTRKQKMIYKTNKEADYKNLNDAIHGVVRLEYSQKYYDDFLRILASFYERKASPAHILLKISTLRNTNGLKKAALEIGKACRSIFLLRLGINPDLRAEIQQETLKGERWHKFEDEIFIGHGGKLQEESLEEQHRTLLILNVVLDCLAFWNTLAIQQIAEELRKEGYKFDVKDLKYISPTMTGHIDLIGKLPIDFNRKPPFQFVENEMVNLRN